MNNESRESGPVKNTNSSEASQLQNCLECHEFFGSPATEFLCSMCYRDKLRKKSEEINEQPMAKPAEKAVLIQDQEEITQPEEVVKEEKKEEPVIDSSKCKTCTRKLGMHGFKCRCDAYFCKLHRLPEEHECDFDFKSLEREKLKAANPVVAASRVAQI